MRSCCRCPRWKERLDELQSSREWVAREIERAPLRAQLDAILATKHLSGWGRSQFPCFTSTKVQILTRTLRLLVYVGTLQSITTSTRCAVASAILSPCPVRPRMQNACHPKWPAEFSVLIANMYIHVYIHAYIAIKYMCTPTKCRGPQVRV